MAEGDSLHRYDRKEMRERAARLSAGQQTLLATLALITTQFDEIETLFTVLQAKAAAGVLTNTCTTPGGAYRRPGTFTPWRDLP